MANDWFRLRETGDGLPGNEYRADVRGLDIDGRSGTKTSAGAAPWTVRVYADSSTLSALESELGAGEKRFDSVPDRQLNSIFGAEQSAERWEQEFRVGAP